MIASLVVLTVVCLIVLCGGASQDRMIQEQHDALLAARYAGK